MKLEAATACPGADDGPDKSPVIGRGLACLTTRQFITTLLRDETGCLCFLIPLDEAEALGAKQHAERSFHDVKLAWDGIIAHQSHAGY